MSKKTKQTARPRYLTNDGQIRMSDGSLLRVIVDDQPDGSQELLIPEVLEDDRLDHDRPEQMFEPLDSGSGFLRMPSKPDSKVDYWGYLKIYGLYYQIFVFNGKWSMTQYSEGTIPADAQAVK